MYFRYFINIFLWKSLGPFICTNLNLLHQRMLCAKYGWNWLGGSWEKDFKILYFRYDELSPLGKEWSPLFEQTWIPLTQGCFVQSLVKIGPAVLEKKIRKCEYYRRMDDRWSGKLTWAFSSVEPKTLSACTWD